MDPNNQQLSKLDPKLREAYERVMGTTNPSNTTPSHAPQTVSTTGISTPSSPTPPSPTPIPSAPAAVSPAPQPVQSTSFSTPHPIPTATPQTGAAHKEPEKVQLNTQMHGYVASKKKKGVSPILIVLGIIVFLAAYTIFWLKFFNVSLPIPFLSQ